jgi:drug/metabolite transporter (DMT)-like permease
MYRMLFALPIFAVMAWWASRGKAPLTRKDWLGVLWLGFTGYYLASFLDFAGLAYISASLERLILYLNPTLVLLLGLVMYKRRVSAPQIIGMAISYCGVVLVFGHEITLQGADAAWGALLVFLSAVSYALYLVYSGEMVRRLGSLRLVGLATTVACLLLPAAVRAAAAHERRRRRARGDLAVAAQRHAVHGRAGADGDDGHRTHRRRAWPRRPAWWARCRPS